jgi:UDP:flavonoid glycosyltransferase YjiC (YdhE family)
MQTRNTSQLQAGSVAIQPASGRARVLISYSTESHQSSPHRVQTALDALAGLPLDGLATTSGAFSTAPLRVPGNATVLDYLRHGSVIATVELMVCHGGHGTTMAALSCGVPLICVPGLGRDQAPIAARVSELGLGIALDSEARTRTIRGAVMAILADHHYRSHA